MSSIKRPASTTQAKMAPMSPLPPHVHRIFLDAVSHHQANRYSQAENLYDRILTEFPRHPDTLHLRGLLAFHQHQHVQALSWITQALEVDSSKPHYHYNLGLILEKENREEEAIAAYRKAISINPGYAEALENLGNVYRRRRNWTEAISTLQEALRLKPQSADIHNALGVTYKEQGGPESALRHYQHALKLTPQHAEALNNMGVIFQDQGQLGKAAEAFQKAISYKPGYANAHYHLGLVRLWQGQEEEASRSFARSADLTYNHGRGLAPAFVTKARITHDYEQLQYLAAHIPTLALDNDYHQTLESVYRLMTHNPTDSTFTNLTADEQRLLVPSFNRFLFIRSTPRLDNPTINSQLDVADIEARYSSTKPEAMFVDELLSAEALSNLRAFCLESTIWKRDYQNGYIGTFLANGFACPLLLQIAEELRVRFPGVFQHHQLQQAWAFKQDKAHRGLNMHADAAAVNVNFWITPDEANRNPESGGLIIWNKEAPDDWDFAQFNNEQYAGRIQTFLEENHATALTIPYKQNRAVIFNSNLFHKSDVIDFHDTYVCRRINVTFLYGRRQQSHKI